VTFGRTASTAISDPSCAISLIVAAPENSTDTPGRMFGPDAGGAVGEVTAPGLQDARQAQDARTTRRRFINRLLSVS
jgi:hypothetical protein